MREMKIGWLCALAAVAVICFAVPAEATCGGGGQVVFNAPVMSYAAPVAVAAAPVYYQPQMAFAAPVFAAPVYQQAAVVQKTVVAAPVVNQRVVVRNRTPVFSQRTVVRQRGSAAVVTY